MKATADLADLVDRVRLLIGAAERAGQSEAWLRQTADDVVAALGELTEWRDGLDDPRRRRTLDLAVRVQRAHAQGLRIIELCERFGRGRGTIYRLLRVPTHRGTFACETAGV